jgi:hypothetical protein
LAGGNSVNLTIRKVNNAIRLTNDQIIKITNPDGLMMLNSESSTRLNSALYTETAISNVNLIKEFYITPDQTITSVPTNYGAFVCFNMINLSYVDVRLPQTITTIGDNFCGSMLRSCSSLTSLPSDFNLPQNISGISVHGFCNGMFFNCTSLQSLPNNFNLPQGMFAIQGDYFCDMMFRDCSSLTSLPSGFNLPQNISKMGNVSLRYMFNGCTSLTSLPNGFNLPQALSGALGAGLSQYMFSGCSKLASLPIGFNLPQNISHSN